MTSDLTKLISYLDSLQAEPKPEPVIKMEENKLHPLLQAMQELKEEGVVESVETYVNLDEVKAHEEVGEVEHVHEKVEEPIEEASPDTLEGSFTEDLVASKRWLCEKLAKGLKGNTVHTIYALGSWYGNIGIYLEEAGIEFKRLVCVEIDQDSLEKTNDVLADLKNKGKLVLLHQKAEDVVYDKPGIVINTSCNETGPVFMTKIPDNMLCALQARNNVDDVLLETDSLEDFKELFPLKKTYYSGEKELADPEVTYDRYMVIGRAGKMLDETASTGLGGGSAGSSGGQMVGGPTTYEQEYNKFKRKGPRRIVAMTNEDEVVSDTPVTSNAPTEPKKRKKPIPHGKSYAGKLYHGSLINNIKRFYPLTHFGTKKSTIDRLLFNAYHGMKLGPSKYTKATVYEVDVNLKNLVEITDFDGVHYPLYYFWELQRKNLITAEKVAEINTNYDLDLSKELIKYTKKLSIDGFVYKNKYEDKGSWSYVVINPNDARITSKTEIDLVNTKPDEYFTNLGTWSRKYLKGIQKEYAKKNIKEEQTTLNDIYNNTYPADDEQIWNHVGRMDFKTPLEVGVIRPHVLSFVLTNQYEVETLDELIEMLDDSQKEILDHYMNDPNLSDQVIVLSDGLIVDGNHRALAAALTDKSLKYVDVNAMQEIDEEKTQIVELTEKPYPYQIIFQEDGYYRFEFTTDKNLTYTVVLNTAQEYHDNDLIDKVNKDPEDLTTMDISFHANEGDDHVTSITGTGDAFRVFSTVTDMVKGAVERTKPDMITMAASVDEPSRVSLYRSMARRLTKVIPEYTYYKANKGNNFTEYTLIRRDILK